MELVRQKLRLLLIIEMSMGHLVHPESIMDVSGIGKKTFEKLEHQIKVD